MRIPAVTIVFLFLFSFLIDFFIAKDIRRFSRGKPHRNIGVTIHWVVSVLLWAFLVVTLSLPRRGIDSDLLPVMWMLYSYLSVYIGKMGYVVVSSIGMLLNMMTNKLKGRQKNPGKWFTWIGIIVGLALCGVMWIGVFYTRKKIEIVEETVYSEKLPNAFENYRIAQISDLHVGTWGEDTLFVSKLVDVVNELNPDLIVFTGDLVNRHTREADPFLKILKRLHAPDGVYSILGNHDYGDYLDWNNPSDRRENNKLLEDYQRNIGWRLLNNEWEWLKKGSDSILLIGIENWGDPPFPTYGDLDRAISAEKDSDIHQNDKNFKILLSHNPEHWNREVSKKTNIDLTLSGHTHAMQIMFRIGKHKWSPSVFRYEQWGGKFIRENAEGKPVQLYVNIGAGEVGMPSRLFGAYPEITLLTLKKGTDKVDD